MQVGPGEIGGRELGAGDCGIGEICTAELGFLEIAAVEFGIAEVGALQFCAGKVGAAGGDALERSPVALHPRELGLLGVGACERGPGQRRFLEIGPGQVGLAQIAVGEVRADQIGAGKRAAAQDDVALAALLPVDLGGRGGPAIGRWRALGEPRQSAAGCQCEQPAGAACRAGRTWVVAKLWHRKLRHGRSQPSTIRPQPLMRQAGTSQRRQASVLAPLAQLVSWRLPLSCGVGRSRLSSWSPRCSRVS